MPNLASRRMDDQHCSEDIQASFGILRNRACRWRGTYDGNLAVFIHQIAVFWIKGSAIN